MITLRHARRTRLRSLGCRALLPLLLALWAELPGWAASSLAAWRFAEDGSLQLRTAPGVSLRAFFEEGPPGRGPRVWIDLPGPPVRSRSLVGSGPLQQVRIGRPDASTTRLVLEFQPGTRLDPRQLRLVGIARDRWRMDFQGLAGTPALNLGEGDLEAPAPVPATTSLRPWWSRDDSRDDSPALPTLPRGRFRVVIDPGHGGPDPGAVGIQGLRETDVVLDVSLQAAQLLQARGVSVQLTRTSEVDVDLPPRVALANSIGAHVFVSVHANALSLDRPDVNGVETFYFEGGRSQQLASLIQARLMAVSAGTPDRGARPGRFYVIRRTTMPSSLVELGFVTGSLDAPRLADPGFRRRLAEALAAAILEFLNR
jgi:N-acetylmuramoyl-L-alanine amidase